ncbi:MAG: amino acid ABC transporter permease [Chloroflexota bacterium]|nr:amino acid ABC transporter permease [Chloroflexota bacterium]
MQFDLAVVTRYLPILARSSIVTIELTAICLSLGTGIGLLLALMRVSGNPLMVGFSAGYSWLIRGIPLLVLLFFSYYALPQLGLKFSAFGAAILAISIDTGAYTSEIIRSGIISVDRGQYEAARALHLSPVWTMRRIILPQAIRVIVPPYFSNAIVLLKATSLAGVITVAELTGDANRIVSSTFRPLEILTIVALLYLILSSGLAGLQYGFEHSSRAR